MLSPKGTSDALEQLYSLLQIKKKIPSSAAEVKVMAPLNIFKLQKNKLEYLNFVFPATVAKILGVLRRLHCIMGDYGQC